MLPPLLPPHPPPPSSPRPRRPRFTELLQLLERLEPQHAWSQLQGQRRRAAMSGAQA